VPIPRYKSNMSHMEILGRLRRIQHKEFQLTKKQRLKNTTKEDRHANGLETLNDTIVDEQKSVGDLYMMKMIATEKTGHCPKYKLKAGSFEPDYSRCSTVEGSVDKNEHSSAVSRIYAVQRSEALGLLLFRQINATDTSAKSSESELNGALALIDELEPRDAFESMLVSQMVATYNAAMELIGRGRRTDWADNLERNINLSNRLMVTYTKQMQTLHKHRQGGKQTVTVKHVNVESGGQAIVGDVHAANPE